MASIYLPPLSLTNLIIGSTQKIALYSKGTATVSNLVGGLRYPNSYKQVGSVSNGNMSVFGTFTNGQIQIQTDGQSALYEIGTAPVVTDVFGRSELIPSPIGFTNVSNNLTPQMLLSNGLLVNLGSASIVLIMPTGAELDAATNFQNFNESFTFHVYAGSGQIQIGDGTNVTLQTSRTVPTSNSTTFVCVRVGVAQYFVYRIGG